ncbi:MAG: DEAD/DEAH box helicase, partial [Spirochaetota bacterium]
HKINHNDSTINILIGSKKFTEGWSSWRVSTMGLMNIGATEGAQIIQLFGRGVRLKGFNFSLKRSTRVSLPEGISRPKYIEILETLSIFGIHADYMAQFRDFLEEEGLPADTERLEFFLPVVRNLGTQPLKTIRLKKQINGITTEFGDAFRKLAPIPTLDLPTEYLQKNQVILNWYPKIQAIRSQGLAGEENTAPHTAHLQPRHIAFLDMDQVYFEIERYKAERGWYNFNITRKAIQKLLLDQSWYQLYIPENELELDRFEKIYEWQEIAIALLKKYVERYYSYKKREWEMPHLEYCEVNANDPNLLLHESPDGGGYRILIEESQEEIIEKLKELKALIESGNLKTWEFRGIQALWFGKHLYQPLLYLEHGIVEISPVPLNRGEKDFVEDLKAFCDQNVGCLAGKELYLLRNLSKGKGVGFFEAGNFYPDFILWVLVQEKQYVTFIDPKGLRNIGFQDPKIQFYQTIKDIEQRLGNPQVILNSFIISNTPSHEIERLWGIDKADILAKHIVFQEEDKKTYIRQIFENIMG